MGLLALKVLKTRMNIAQYVCKNLINGYYSAPDETIIFLSTKSTKKNKHEKYIPQLFCLFFFFVVRAFRVFRGQCFSFLFSACPLSLGPMGQIRHDDNEQFCIVSIVT